MNMNGRVYDPVLARFLSPDNFIQAPNNTQSFNRYSYVLNNPLKYTDPSGWEWTETTLELLNDKGGQWSDMASSQKESGNYKEARERKQIEQKNKVKTLVQIVGHAVNNAPGEIFKNTCSTFKLDENRTKLGLNGAWNTTAGVLGTIGAGSYILATDGIGAGFGGGVALSLSIGEVGIGLAQMTSAITGESATGNESIHQGSTLPGVVAYEQNSTIAPLIDAGAAFATAPLTGGRLKDGFGLTEEVSKLSKAKTTFRAIQNSGNVVDTTLDTFGFGNELRKFVTPASDNTRVVRSQTSLLQLRR